MLDTIDIFPPDLIASLRNPEDDVAESVAEARACRQSNKISVRRAKAEAHLADILPPRISDSESWHIISHGDIDSLSYLAYALALRFLSGIFLRTENHRQKGVA